MRHFTDQRHPRSWMMGWGLLFVSACSASGGSAGLPAGGQSGDEGTQLASPCLPNERAAFLGELQQIEAGIATVVLSDALTPTASMQLDSLQGELSGCASGYFTADLPSPGQQVLVVLFPREETMSSYSMAIAERQGEEIIFSPSGAVPSFRIDELIDPNCESKWEEANASSSASAGTGAIAADCSGIN